MAVGCVVGGAPAQQVGPKADLPPAQNLATSTTRARCFGAAILTLLTATTAQADLIVVDAWVRDAPPNAYMRAGYGTLRNNGTQALTITDVRSPDFERAEVHETSFKNGMMTMRRVEQIVVAPGGRFDFNPNGNHVMLIAPKRAVHKGDKIEMEWVLAGGKVVKSVVEVRGAP